MKTGFGRNARETLTRLYKAGFEIVEFAACDMKDGDPGLNKYPWKVRSVYPPDPNSWAHLRENEGAMMALTHGHMMIDQVIKEEKPDLCIFVEDIWHIQGFMMKPWWNKVPCIVWTPVDSLPIMPVFSDLKEKFKHLWVNASFAERELRKVGLESITIPNLINVKDFHPLPLEQKDNLRRSCNLSDSFTVGFVFRNQLRKLVVTLMEAFSLFQKKYPEANGKLLFHTHFNESHGWNIMGAAKELGISNSDIYTSYKCRHCGAALVIPFAGSEIDCPSCRREKALHNVSIHHGFTEGELNTFYNLLDCYAHPATSGGHEVPVQEAMLAGVPTGTVNYAFGETYVSGGSYPFEHHFYRERESNFLKSQPTIESILSYLEFCYIDKLKAQQKAEETRKWAEEYFDPDKLANIIIDYIKEIPPHDYDFDFHDIKNVDYPPDYSIADNTDFILDLYNGIFGLAVHKGHPEVVSYVDQLHHSSREEIVRHMKGLAEEHNRRQKPVPLESFIEENGKKRVIYVEPGGLIECFSWLYVLESLKEKYPLDEWDHYISCNPDHSHIFGHVTWIKGIVPYLPVLDQPFFLEGRAGHKGYFDIAYQPYLNPSWAHNGLD